MTENYTTIGEGIWYGVSYRINEAKVVEEHGKSYIMLDYDVKNLEDKDSDEFERFLGGLVTASLARELDNKELEDKGKS